jgi:hypothetical protein
VCKASVEDAAAEYKQIINGMTTTVLHTAPVEAIQNNAIYLSISHAQVIRLHT